MTMYIIDYDDIWIKKIDNIDECKYESYEKHKSFEEAKEKLIEYWELCILKSKQGLKDAKKIKVTHNDKTN